MVTCLQALQFERLVTPEECMTIRKRIAEWDFKHDPASERLAELGNAKQAAKKTA